MADVDHGWQNEVMEAVACIRALAHDVGLERNAAWEVFFNLVIVGHAEVYKAAERESKDGDQKGEEYGLEDAAAASACPCSLVVLLGREEVALGSQGSRASFFYARLQIFDGWFSLC